MPEGVLWRSAIVAVGDRDGIDEHVLALCHDLARAGHAALAQGMRDRLLERRPPRRCAHFGVGIGAVATTTGVGVVTPAVAFHWILSTSTVESYSPFPASQMVN